MPSKGPTGGIKTYEIWTAARLARDHAVHDRDVLTALLSAELGRPFNRRALFESIRKGRQNNAGAGPRGLARRKASQAVIDTMEWAESPASGPPPHLPNQPPPPAVLVPYDAPDPDAEALASPDALLARLGELVALLSGGVADTLAHAEGLLARLGELAEGLEARLAAPAGAVGNPGSGATANGANRIPTRAGIPADPGPK